MAIRSILSYPNPKLREKAKPIENIDDEVRALARDMAETMYAAPGVGLAAIQIGIARRMIVVDIREENGPSQLKVIINPELLSVENEIVWEEGCLSVPDVKEEVKRMGKVTVKYMNINGEEIVETADNLFAVVLQHEIDHLNGMLFIDRLSKVKQGLIKKKLKSSSAKKTSQP